MKSFFDQSYFIKKKCIQENVSEGSKQDSSYKIIWTKMFTYLNTKKLITDNVLYLGERALSLLGTSVPIEILDFTEQHYDL